MIKDWTKKIGPAHRRTGTIRLGGRHPVCPKKLRSAPLLDCRNQLFTPSKCTKKHVFSKHTFRCSCFLFLLNFIFQFHRLLFLYCPNFWRFARIFSRLGGGCPPPPRLVRPWSCQYEDILVVFYENLQSGFHKKNNVTCLKYNIFFEVRSPSHPRLCKLG